MITVDDFKNRFRDRQHKIQGARGEFAVIVPIVNINGEAHILYELRSARIDRQPGEVCFPGGEIEAGETPREAAIRETWEEIGIPSSEISIIAELDTFHPPTNIVIYPFLAEISREGLDNMKLSEYEVAECFLVPVSEFLKKPYTYKYSMKPELGDDFEYDKIGVKGQSYNWHPMKHKVISWEYNGKYIWGLTALITQWTMKILDGRVE